MTRVLLTVQYDGFAYAGWQRQPLDKGVSVQYVLEKALRKVVGEAVGVHGAGRTDAGVHALGQRCHFELLRPTPIDRLPQIINWQLPRDIRVTAAQAVADDFHARYNARGKHYRYVLEQCAPPSAFGGRYTWQLDRQLDVAAMRDAAQPLLGEHDFRHFTLSGVSAKNFVRTITRLELSQPPAGSELLPWQQLTQPLAIDVEGNGFLYKMVRIIAARLVAVGQGRLDAAQVAGYLDGSCTKRIPPAPPQGLTLVNVFY